MKYWDNYIENISQTPNEYYRDMTNEIVRSQWYNTTLLFNIKEETQVGSFKFCDMEAWVQTVTTFTNNIIKDSNDFRELLFKHNPHHTVRGQYYQHDNNWWIVYDTSDESSVHATSLIRRCNNVLKWLDKDTGFIYEYPCVLEYDISATNPRVDKDIIVANQSITLVVQANENTKKLKRNDRFVFNNLTYKFVAYNNYHQVPTIDGDVTLYFIDLDLDIEKPTDDLVNGIADKYEYNYEVIINNAPTQQIKGFSSTMLASVILNGENTDKVVTWEGNKYVAIDQNGVYTLNGSVGDVAQITAKFGSFSQTVNINIIDSVPQIKEIVISPLISELNEQETVEFDVALYIDGERQDNIPTYTVSGASSNNYILSQNDNKFTLTNLHKSKDLLHIIFAINDAEAEMSIRLKALF